MNYIVSYQKASDEYTTYELNAPDGSTELCTIDGITYVSVPEGEALPDDQPQQIADSITTPVMTQALIESIKAASPHVQLIAQRMIDRIRERYSVDDELFFARIAGGASLGRYDITPGEQLELDDYQQHVEATRQWGRDQRAALGLVISDDT